MRTIITVLSLFCLVFLSVLSVSADTIIRYRDGATIQKDATATKGRIEIPLDADILENTLTITPAIGTAIQSVETRTSAARTASGAEKERLTEQRQRLKDRLKALETREAIFISAAKSQSGKAPRKSKANPDPLQNIRQGTDFAIAQLEAVYTARRTTEQEIKKIDESLAIAATKKYPAQRFLKIAVSPPHGRVTVRYATTGSGWLPRYNLHVSAHAPARLELLAPPTESSSHQTYVSMGILAERATARTFAVRPGKEHVADFLLELTESRFTDDLYNTFSGVVTHNNRNYLPAGDVSLFRDGSYAGRFCFEGLSSGRSKVITVGGRLP